MAQAEALPLLLPREKAPAAVLIGARCGHGALEIRAKTHCALSTYLVSPSLPAGLQGGKYHPQRPLSPSPTRNAVATLTSFQSIKYFLPPDLCTASPAMGSALPSALHVVGSSVFGFNAKGSHVFLDSLIGTIGTDGLPPPRTCTLPLSPSPVSFRHCGFFRAKSTLLTILPQGSSRGSDT